MLPIVFATQAVQPRTINSGLCHYQVNCEIAVGGSGKCFAFIHINCNLAKLLNTIDQMV